MKTDKKDFKKISPISKLDLERFDINKINGIFYLIYI